jgi:hypothetical protein
LSQNNQGIFTRSSEAKAKKTLLEFSAPNINNIHIGPTIDLENSSLSLASSTWCKLIYSVERYMKMQVLISKTFCRKTPPSPSRTFPRK